jgi:hypothetical protein
VFHISFYDKSVFEENRSSAYTLAHIPMGPVSFVRRGTRVGVGDLEFIGI